MQHLDELKGSADAFCASRLPAGHPAAVAPPPSGPEELLDATRDAVVGS